MKKFLHACTSLVVVFALVTAFSPFVTSAGAPQNASNNMTRQKISETSDHVIAFELPTATTADVVITFPADFDLTGATTDTGTLSGQEITIAGSVTAGQAFTVTVSDVVNPATAGNQIITIATDVDAGQITVPIINDDQIIVTAKVDQVLYFDVRDNTVGTADDNTVGFGILDASDTRYATNDALGSTTAAPSSELEAGTNAPGGYFIDVTGETLTSLQNPTDTIDGLFTASATPAAGTEAFGFSVTQSQTSTGTSVATISSDYSGTYHLPDSGTVETLVTNPGPASNEIFDLTYVANINSLTEAGDYATAFTFTMTGLF